MLGVPAGATVLWSTCGLDLDQIDTAMLGALVSSSLESPKRLKTQHNKNSGFLRIDVCFFGDFLRILQYHGQSPLNHLVFSSQLKQI